MLLMVFSLLVRKINFLGFKKQVKYTISSTVPQAKAKVEALIILYIPFSPSVFKEQHPTVFPSKITRRYRYHRK